MATGSVGAMDISTLAQPANTKIVLIVMDGLGGFADVDASGVPRGTELEEAVTPNLDQLVSEGACGLADPVGPGITPGSGPGHLGLFGYDPEEFELGRGALSAAGLGIELLPGDVAARGNLCTLDADGIITDRRAGRIGDTEACAIVNRLAQGVDIQGVEVIFRHEREHRVLVVLRGADLSPQVSDTDPQKTGVPPLRPVAENPDATHAENVIVALDGQARALLAHEPQANGLLLRGFDTLRSLPSFAQRYQLRAACIAIYPMYRGISRILGMDVLGPPSDLDGQIEILESQWSNYDYFFVHHKPTDSAGEDGDRARKIAAIEQLDAVIPAIRALGPDVIMVSGDHSTPTQMAAHSWHPVPVLLWSNRVGRDGVSRFGESSCVVGSLGHRPLKDYMAIALANAGRLAKYGA